MSADRGSFIDAVKSGDLEAVRTSLGSDAHLASERSSTGESPLMAALYRGHSEIVAALIDAGADLDLFAAAATGRSGDLRQILQEGGNVNGYAHDGWTPLHLAAFFGQLDAARLLLDAGADVHAVSRNSLTNTPLHAATAGKHATVALLLHSRGADAHAIDSGGYSPLQIAEQNGLTDVVSALRV
jgi:ankyrin repeat protein